MDVLKTIVFQITIFHQPRFPSPPLIRAPPLVRSNGRPTKPQAPCGLHAGKKDANDRLTSLMGATRLRTKI